LAYYAHKNDNIDDLITNHDLKIIVKDYINYRKKNNLTLDHNLENIKEYDYIFKEKILISDNDLSDNYNSLSDLNKNSDNSIEISLNTKYNDSDSSDNDDNHNHHNTLNNKKNYENKSNNKDKNDYKIFHKKNKSRDTGGCLKNYEKFNNNIINFKLKSTNDFNNTHKKFLEDCNNNNNILYNKKYLIKLDLENIHNKLNNINKNDEILFNNFFKNGNIIIQKDYYNNLIDYYNILFTNRKKKYKIIYDKEENSYNFKVIFKKLEKRKTSNLNKYYYKRKNYLMLINK